MTGRLDQAANSLTHYHALLCQREYDWGGELGSAARVVGRYGQWCDWSSLGDTLTSALKELDSPIPPKELDATGILEDPIRVVMDALTDPLPFGVAVVRQTGLEISNPLPFVLEGHQFCYHIFDGVDHSIPCTVTKVMVSADRPYLEVNGRTFRAADPVSGSRVRLVTDGASRWSVVDERNGSWFPEGVPRKYDDMGIGYFHGNDHVVDVPPGVITIAVSRGCEFRPVRRKLLLDRPGETVVAISPKRLYDAAAMGWYGADLHVHLNYSGDLICTMRDAALMQEGEGLHLMSLVAANCSTEFVYDHKEFKHFVGQELPWSKPGMLATWGFEYRNDLFGHFTVFGGGEPTRYSTGHRRSETIVDWPSNSVAAAEAREKGGIVTYTHSVGTDIGSVSALHNKVFAPYRARVSDGREIVVDAALGLVDAIDLGSPSLIEGVEFLYHRLLGCGLHLAATAGTDSLLSHSHTRLHSGPPGVFRAFANLDRKPLSVTEWQNAVRSGRTFVTNGPWLEFEVAEHGPGDTVTVASPRVLPIYVKTVGADVDQVEVVGPDGTVAMLDARGYSEEAELIATADITEPTWLAAVVHGGRPQKGDRSQPQIYAHTSPIWVEVAGRSVRRATDALWCLDWLDSFEKLIQDHGSFKSADQLQDIVSLIDQARVVYQRIVDDTGSQTVDSGDLNPLVGA